MLTMPTFESLPVSPNAPRSRADGNCRTCTEEITCEPSRSTAHLLQIGQAIPWRRFPKTHLAVRDQSSLCGFRMRSERYRANEAQ
jgi:hypothetical protein